MSQEAGLLDREVETLLGLLPRLQGEGGQLAVPTVVYGAHNTAGEGVLVLQDLLSEGYSRPSLGPSLPLTTLVTTVVALARLHAASSVLVEDTGREAVLQQFPHLDCHYYDCDSVTAEVSDTLKTLSLLVRRVPGMWLLQERVEQWRAGAWGALTHLRRRRPPPPLLCLVHGSPAIENLLTLGDQVILTDWKLAALGSSMADLSLLLLSSTDRETRKQQTGPLLETYHSALCSALVRLGRDPRQLWPHLTVDSLVQEYHRCVFGSLLTAACLLTRQLQGLEAAFREAGGQQQGETLRMVGRRTIELVEEGYDEGWGGGEQGGTQESCSSLTLVLPRTASTAS